MNIRPATSTDIEAIAQLSGELGYPATVEDVGRRMPAIAIADDHAVYVAEAEEGSVVGWIHVFAAMRLESEPFAELGGLVVAETHRGHGVGRLLCEHAGRWASRQGFRSLRVRTRAEREATHRFYEHVGFKQLKTQRVYAIKLRPRDP